MRRVCAVEFLVLFMRAISRVLVKREILKKHLRGFSKRKKTLRLEGCIDYKKEKKCGTDTA